MKSFEEWKRERQEDADFVNKAILIWIVLMTLIAGMVA